MKNKWTLNEIQFLKDNYNKMTTKEIALKLNKTIVSIRHKKIRLKLIIKKMWALNEIQFLKDNYNKMTTKELSKKLNRTTTAINSKLNFLKLKRLKKWNSDNINFLKNNYKNLSNKELSKILNKSIYIIATYACNLELQKSKKFRYNQISNLNKKRGRNLNLKKLKIIAKRYKTRTEFAKNDSTAYYTALKLKCLDKICKHMIPGRYSTPQLILYEILKILINSKILYNDRKTIKPYELDIFIPEFNLAFEYQGMRYHKNNKNDIIKKRLCNNKNIFLIEIKETSYNYFEDIKYQLLNNLNLINKIYKNKICINDINNLNKKEIYINVSKNILNYNEIIYKISQYTSIKDFYKNDRKLYNKLVRLKLLKDMTKNLIRWHKSYNKN